MEEVGGTQSINDSVTTSAIYFSAIAAGVWVFGALQVCKKYNSNRENCVATDDNLLVDRALHCRNFTGN